MRIVLWLVMIFPLLLTACSKTEGKDNNFVLAEANGQKIYLDEALKGMPKNLSSTDSVSYVKEYIANRVREIVLYDQAAKNIPHSQDIDKMVESYRRSLVIFEYQQQVLNEKIKSEIGEEELKAYYDKNSGRFTVDQNLVKGIFLKVPKDAPNISKLKQWCRKPDSKALQKIESYSVQNATIYNYFMDQWTPLDDILSDMPRMSDSQADFFKNSRNMEMQDDEFCYLIYIEDYVTRGNKAPYDYIKPVVTNVMMNSKKTDFVRKFEQDLLKEAEKKGKIIYY